MSKYAWGQSSRTFLSQCATDLQVLWNRVIARDDLPFDLKVTCGHRNEADQNKVYAAGKSRLKFPSSKHNKFPSLAVDVSPFIGGAISWDWELYNKLAPIVKDEWEKMTKEAAAMGRTLPKLVWGGDWAKFKDGPHWQLGD